MPLESCMILLDNSEYMRNGDYIPSRLEAQSDAANLLVNAKTQSNPESTVGVIAMCTPGPMTGAQLLVSPTDDLGKILSALHGVKLCGEIMGGNHGTTSSSSSIVKKDAVDIAASVQVAALALKHRRNKNGSQRIILFVGSPLNHADKRAFIKVGKQLKKNNVFIDVIALGELEENEPKLKELVDAANGGAAAAGGGEDGNDGDDHGAERTCRLVTIPAGVLPSDVLVTSPILRMDGGGGGMMRGGDGLGAAGAVGGGGFAEYGGVDPNMDPELAMALRVSMEEERARQERVAAAAAAAGNNSEEAKSSEETAGSDVAMGVMAGENGEMNDEDALLQQALAMSMAENQASDMGIAEDNEVADATMDTTAGAGDEEDDEDAAMQMALAMSMQGEEGSSGVQQQFQDPEFVNQLLGSLPGVDPSDPAIQEALRLANERKSEEEDDDETKGRD